MKEVVYQSLRDEITAWFTAMNNYEIGQYAVVVVVFSLLLKETNFTILAFGAIAIIGFIFIVSKIYTDVQNKATRMGSYLLFAYELKAREKSNTTDEEFEYWILANRSSSARSLEGKEKDYFGFNKEFSRFYERQLKAVIFIWTLTTIKMILSINEPPQIGRFGIVVISIFWLAILIYSIVINCKDNKASKTYAKEQVKIWKEYWEAKPENDDYFLREVYGIKLNRK